MKTLILITLLLVSPLICFAQNTTTQLKPKQEKSIYIPKNLDECFVELKKVLTKEQLEEFKNKDEKDVVSYHHSLGMWIRNNWGLWSKSRLAEYFNGIGIYHPDDMSGIILDSFHRSLNNKDIRLKEQVKYYQEYWKKIKEKKSSTPK